METKEADPGTVRASAAAAAPVDWKRNARLLWEAIPHKPYFFAALAGWFALFHFFGNAARGYVDSSSLFGWLEYSYQTPDDSHGVLVPFVVIGLLIWKGDRLAKVPTRIWGWAIVGVIMGLAIHYLGYAVQQTRVSLLGFLLGLYSLIGLYVGPKGLASLFFPYFLLIFLMPMGNYAEVITVPLRHAAAMMSAGFASDVLGVDVIREGTQLYSSDRSFEFDVAPACSGVRGLTTLLALTTVMAFVTLNGWWRRAIMIALAAPLALLGNWARITTVIVVAEAFNQEAAMKIEQKFGFVTFAVSLAIVMIVGRLLEGRPSKAKTVSAAEADLREAELSEK